MSGTLDISTEGLLQTGEEAGSCKPAIVIQETNTPIAVAASASNKVVVGKNKSVNVQSASAQNISAAADPGKEVVRKNEILAISTGGRPGADGRDGADGQDGADGAPGAPGINGIDGVDGESDKNYRHVQTNPESVWTIIHGLNKYPAINVVDSGGTEVVGDVVYVSSGTITVHFNAAFSGEAFCN